MANEGVAENPGQPGAGGNTGIDSPKPTATGPTPAGQGNEPSALNPNDPPKEKTYSFKEDRADWVPRNRLNEESGKRTKLETEVAALRAAHELSDKRLRLAMGLEVPTKDEQELNDIREAMYKVNPKLKLLDHLDEEQLSRILEAADTATSTSRAQWERHRVEMLSDLEEEAADLLGIEKLSDAQVKRLHRSFREEAREQAAGRAKAERGQDSTYDYANDFVSRYERGDKKLLKEFAKSFMDEWGIPARRSTAALALTRQNRPVPRGERTRTHLTQGPPKIDYNDDNAFKEALLTARRGGGDV